MTTTIAELRAAARADLPAGLTPAAVPHRPAEPGERIESARDYSGARYKYDECLLRQGFYQLDTDSDAHYYGTWCSPRRRVLVSFTEGDVFVNAYDDEAAFVRGLVAVREFDSTARVDVGLRTVDPAEIALLDRAGIKHNNALNFCAEDDCAEPVAPDAGSSRCPQHRGTFCLMCGGDRRTVIAPVCVDGAAHAWRVR